jgi:hypothetical protein
MKNKPLWIFFGCCAIPLTLAYIALESNWLPGSGTNKGQFLASEVHIDNWQIKEKKLWTIALQTPLSCEELCTKQITEMKNMYVALGKHQSKVDIAVLSNNDTLTDLTQYNISKTLQVGALYLIDHRGLVVLEYPFVDSVDERRAIQKGLLKDLKKLLKYARTS